MHTQWLGSPYEGSQESEEVRKRQARVNAVSERLRQAIDTVPSAASKPTLVSGIGTLGESRSMTRPSDLNKVWEDETSRVVELLGGVTPKHARDVTDILRLEFTKDEWKRLFNVADGYEPVDGRQDPFPSQTVCIYFKREAHEASK